MNIKTGFLLFSILLLFSCNDDDEITTLPENEYLIELGNYDLLPESLALFPYLGKTKAQFVDALGMEIVLDISESSEGTNYSTGTYFRYDVYEVGDTVRLNYAKEGKYMKLRNDSLDFFFNVGLVAEPHHQFLEENFVADRLNIRFNKTGEFSSNSIVFFHTINQRTWPEISSMPDTLATIDLLGREFQTVLHNSTFGYTPKSDVYFNYDFGIVYFTDHAGKAWRFDKFID